MKTMSWAGKPLSRELVESVRAALEGREVDVESLALGASKILADLLLQARDPITKKVLMSYSELLAKISNLASNVLISRLEVISRIKSFLSRILSGWTIISRTGCIPVRTLRETNLRLRHTSKLVKLHKGALTCLPLEYALIMAALGDVTLLTHTPPRHEYQAGAEAGKP